MIPQEKARELINKYYSLITGVELSYISKLIYLPNGDSNYETTKQCALFCIDEMIRIAPWGGDIDNEIEDGSKEYYIKVKQEIEKL
jgi:hypothetical protein